MHHARFLQVLFLLPELDLSKPFGSMVLRCEERNMGYVFADIDDGSVVIEGSVDGDEGGRDELLVSMW